MKSQVYLSFSDAQHDLYKAILIMIDIQQLTSLISAFRVETEKSAIKWVQRQTCLNITEREQIMQRKHSPEPLARRLKRRQTVGSILQAIADLLATATSETEYNLEKRDGYFDIIYERPTGL